MATREEKRLLRQRADGKFDALYFLDDGTGRPRFEEGVYDEEQARTARQSGWQDVDTNQWMASRRAYGPMVTAPIGARPFVTGDKATHPQSKKSALSEAMRFAAGMGREFGAERPETVDAPAAARAAPPAVRARSPAPVRVSASGGSSALRKHTSLAAGAPRAAAAFEEIMSPEVEAYVREQAEPRDIRPAQQQSDQRLLAARLTRAGAMANSALSRTRPDMRPYDDLERGARQPVEDFLEQLRSEQLQGAEARAQDNQRLQGASFERAGAQDVRDFGFRQAEAKRAEALARDRLAQDERQHQESLTEQRRGRFAASSARTAKEAEKKGMVDPKQLAELQKRSQNASMMREDIETINKFLSQRDVPGVGPLDSMAPELLLSADGTRLRQAAMRLYAAKQHALFGAAVSPQEAKLGLESYGMGTGKSEESFRQGMEALRQEAVSALENIESGFGPEVVQRRRELGGTTAEVLPGAAPTPTGRYRRGRDGKMYAEMSDGSAQEVR